MSDQDYFEPIDLDEVRKSWNKKPPEEDHPAYHHVARMVCEISRLRECIQSLIEQYALCDKGLLMTGGMSALEEAFEVLGLSDPCEAPFHMVCDEPGCQKAATCGWPSPKGYRHTCGDHCKEPE